MPRGNGSFETLPCRLPDAMRAWRCGRAGLPARPCKDPAARSVRSGARVAPVPGRGVDRCRGGRGRDRFPDRGWEDPEDAGPSDPAGPGPADGGRSSPGRTGPARAIECAPATEAYRAYANGRKTGGGGSRRLRPGSAAATRPDLPAPARRVMRFAAAKFAADRGDGGRDRPPRRANRLMAEAFPYSYEADLATARDLAGDWPKLEGLAPDGPPTRCCSSPACRGRARRWSRRSSRHIRGHRGRGDAFLSRAFAPAMEALRRGEADPDRFAEAGRATLSPHGGARGGAGSSRTRRFRPFPGSAMPPRRCRGAFRRLRRDPRDTGCRCGGTCSLRVCTATPTTRFTHGALHPAARGAGVAFWAERLPGRVHILDYEALTAEPEPVIRELIAFAELPWDDACLAPQAAQRSVATLSFAQVRQPIGRGSVAGWRRFEAGSGRPDRGAGTRGAAGTSVGLCPSRNAKGGPGPRVILPDGR
jgi:hypothetical protein